MGDGMTEIHWIRPFAAQAILDAETAVAMFLIILALVKYLVK